MTAVAVVNTIRDRFVAQVATPQQLLVVADNDPDQGELAAKWCRVRVEFDLPQQVSTAPARFRTRGRLLVHLHAAGVASGDAATLALFDSIVAAFSGVQLATPAVRFYRPGLIGSGEASGGWYRRLARVDFYADDVGS